MTPNEYGFEEWYEQATFLADHYNTRIKEAAREGWIAGRVDLAEEPIIASLIKFYDAESIGDLIMRQDIQIGRLQKQLEAALGGKADTPEPRAPREG